MIEKVKRILGISSSTPGSNKLIINYEKLERRVALLEDGRLEEYNIERETDRNIVGSIYKGRVKNLEHGLKAMFVDIGFEKNAFLHFWDAIPAALDSGVEQVARSDKPREDARKKQKRISAKDIPNIYPVGSEVMVQVTKGPIGTKGPRITTNISLAGRYLVLMPYNEQCGISRKIEAPKERERLRKILKSLEIPDGMGVIVRTVGEGQRARYFVRDLTILLEQWQQITANEKAHAPACLFQEPGLIERTVRDFLTDEIDEVMCDDLEAVARMQEVVAQISRRSKSRIKHYSGPQHIFDFYGVQRQIDDAFHRQVWLPCGGYIVIDETEALIAVDVNTGRNKGGKEVDKTILQTNLEAADEIARQVRLRNIGGLIIGDFIDMKNRRDQQAVFMRMKDRLKRDKAKTHVLQLSQLGLMEMTRQRAQESHRTSVYEPCHYCNGRGITKTAMSMSVEVQRALHAVMKRHQDSIHEVRVIVNPNVLDRLRKEDEGLLVDIERRYAGRLSFRADPAMHQEKFLIEDAKANTELKAV